MSDSTRLGVYGDAVWQKAAEMPCCPALPVCSSQGCEVILEVCTVQGELCQLLPFAS